MMASRVLGGLALLLGLTPMVSAQSYPLREALKVGDCVRVELTMKLQGEMRFKRDTKEQSLPLAATATHVYPERVLSLTTTGVPDRVARVYEQAKADISQGTQKSERTLRPERQLIVAQRNKEVPLVYSPSGTLTRSELELTSEHFDSLAIAGLLPGKDVAVGETWKVNNSTAQCLCSFEGLTEHSLTAKLEEVKDKQAKISISGTATGIDIGAMVKMTVNATAHFDTEAKCIVQLDWEQKDERDQGPASPASVVTITNSVKRKKIEQPKSLSDVALVSVPNDFNPSPQTLMLDLLDAERRFQLLHGREWHLVGQTEEHTVLRLMDRGDFVAQVTLMPWKSAEAGKHVSEDDFKDIIGRTPGWIAKKELQVGTVPSGDERWIYRIAEEGTLDGLEVIQNSYVVAGKDGRQVMVVFTFTAKQAEKLGTRDLSIVGSLDFPPIK